MPAIPSTILGTGPTSARSPRTTRITTGRASTALPCSKAAGGGSRAVAASTASTWPILRIWQPDKVTLPASSTANAEQTDWFIPLFSRNRVVPLARMGLYAETGNHDDPSPILRFRTSECSDHSRITQQFSNNNNKKKQEEKPQLKPNTKKKKQFHLFIITFILLGSPTPTPYVCLCFQIFKKKSHLSWRFM